MTNEELIEQIRFSQGDKQELLLQLYEQNRPLIRKVIQSYLRKHAAMDEDDAMQEGFIALLQAVERYNPEMGAFSTYFPYWIRATIARTYGDMAHAKRLPAWIQAQVRQYKQLCADYGREYGCMPSDAFLRARLKLSQEKLDDLRRIMQEAVALSLADPISGSEDLTLGDVIPDRTDKINDLCDRIDAERDAAELWAEVDQLDPRQAQIIRTRFQGDLSVREVADQMQLTQGKVRDGIDRGCRKLARKRKVRQIARDHGFLSTSDLFGGGLQRFLNTGESCVEHAIFRRLENDKID